MSPDAKIVDEVISELRKIVAPGIDITPQSSIMGDLGLDSLAVMNFVMSLEDTFDISLPMDLVVQVETVIDLAAALSDLGAQVTKK